MNYPAISTLGQMLQAAGYNFITPTPATHARVIARSLAGAPALRDIFGWSRPFDLADLAPPYRAIMEQGGLLEPAGSQWRSRVRFSTLGELLFAHSPYPTTEPDAVFFGPDTYRFVRAIQHFLAEDPGFVPSHVVDVGSGSGAGGIFCASVLGAARVTLVDISPKAMAFGQANAGINKVTIEHALGDSLSQVNGQPDFIVCNPPYLVDDRNRIYRDGGGRWGCDLAVRLVSDGLARLAPNGTLLLYTGAPIVAGQDLFWTDMAPVLESRHCSYRYEEIDPDVFGEELDTPAYSQADRIAAVMLVVEGPDRTALGRWKLSGRRAARSG